MFVACEWRGLRRGRGGASGVSRRNITLQGFTSCLLYRTYMISFMQAKRYTQGEKSELGERGRGGGAGIRRPFL